MRAIILMGKATLINQRDTAWPPRQRRNYAANGRGIDTHACTHAHTRTNTNFLTELRLTSIAAESILHLPAVMLIKFQVSG